MRAALIVPCAPTAARAPVRKKRQFAPYELVKAAPPNRGSPKNQLMAVLPVTLAEVNSKQFAHVAGHAPVAGFNDVPLQNSLLLATGVGGLVIIRIVYVRVAGFAFAKKGGPPNGAATVPGGP